MKALEITVKELDAERKRAQKLSPASAVLEQVLRARVADISNASPRQVPMRIRDDECCLTEEADERRLLLLAEERLRLRLTEAEREISLRVRGRFQCHRPAQHSHEWWTYQRSSSSSSA